MFRGCYSHTIDDKGRLSIPAKFRDVLENQFTSPLIVTRLKECLVAYPTDRWRVLEARMDELPSFDRNVLWFRRYFYAPAQECPIDKAGRILVPEQLRGDVGLERDVVLAGLGKYFEIWPKDRYYAAMDNVENYDSILDTLSQMKL